MMSNYYIPTIAFTTAAMIVTTPSMTDAFTLPSHSIMTTSNIDTFLEAHPYDSISIQNETPSKLSKRKKSKSNIVSLESTIEAITINCQPFGSIDEIEKRVPITKLQLGSYVEGQVAHFSNFGVFIKTKYALRGGYALLHKSQIPGKKKNWRANFRPGQTMQFRVASINYETAQVGLSLQTAPKRTLNDINVGMEITDAKVLCKTDFGVFVDVGCDVNALVHKSRMGGVLENIQIGEEIKVRILRKDDVRSRLEGSMLSVEEDTILDTLRSNNGNMMSKTSEVMDVAIFADAIQELRDSLGEWN